MLARNPLTAEQQRVLDDANAAAAARKKATRKALLAKAKQLGFKEPDVDMIMAHVAKGEMTINFQASKVIASLNKSVAAVFADTGKVKGRFETGTSGGDTEFSGREKVERDLFGYSEIKEDSPLAERAERPKYAALNVHTLAGGGAESSTYGQSALVLDEAVKKRMTLTAGDSFAFGKNADPAHVATFQHLETLVLERLEKHDGQAWAQSVLDHASGRRGATADFGYLEAQVHGEIDIARDVAYVRGSFNEAFGSAVGDDLRRVAAGKPIIWGFYRARDQMVLEPTRGPAKVAFDRIWAEVQTLRQTRATAGKPIRGDDRDNDLLVKWKALLAAMPPGNIQVTDPSKAGYGQISGRGAADRLPGISKAELALI
jgi:hypothetical protein